MNKINYKPFELHSKDVQELQNKILKNKKTLSLEKKHSSNTLRSGEYKKESDRLDISHLNQILSIDLKESTVLVEPSISFYRLCKKTIVHGQVPMVVPEFKEITVGGAIMGAGLESSSHRYGQVSDTCLEYECLLGNGERITASPRENEDLFWGISGSYGTLAFITLVKMRLLKSKKYVSLRYHRFSDLKSALTTLNEKTDVDFQEAIGFGLNRVTVIQGHMQDNISASFFSLKPWSLWYPKRVEKTLKKKETLPLIDYLFRYDLGTFWMANYIASLATMKNILLRKGDQIAQEALRNLNASFLFRLLFGWACTSKQLFKLWHKVPQRISEKLFFIHDFYAPNEKVYDVLMLFLQKTKISPFWLCPVAATDTPQFLSPHFGNKNYVNIGLYGIPLVSKSIPELSQELEKEIISFGGRKMLYSLTYYDRDFFSKIYDMSRYELLRKKYYAENTFLHLFDKLSHRRHF